MNPKEPDYCEGSSSPSSMIRIRRRHYNTCTAGDNSSDAHDLGAADGTTRWKRLRKGDQPPPFVFNVQRRRIPLVNKVLPSVIVPDAMSGKICQATRRSKRLVDKEYTFKEASSCCPVGGFAPAFDGNRESTDSVSSDAVSEPKTVSSDDISSGCPSPFVDLGDAEVPSGREAVRGNDFSNTLFAEESSPGKDNAATAHDAVLSPDCREPTLEKVIDPSLPSEPLYNFDVFSGVGMMGSGSTNPCPENENVRVCRPASIPQSVTGISRPSPTQPINEPDCGALLKTMTEYCNQFLKSAVQLDGALKQRALEGGADVGVRLEIARLKSKNSELSTVIRVLTEELAGARQELADSKSRELQLKLSLEEIGGVLPDSWEN